ncbi:MAG: hypothetical protein RBR30_00430 [Tenuifilaceae bacterium]|jgi:hypothetical protein|nr:hypothetical protein [Tenuifilaceae bacterium]
MKLEEGGTYSFQVLKKITMPEEGEFFLLRHQSGRRLLIPEKLYARYGIEPGTSIHCKVDKVSCTGKVYLEPLHPLYREGNEYEFELVGEETSADGQGRVLRVKDIFDNTIKVLCACGKPLGSPVVLTVERVRKGVPELYCKGEQSPEPLKKLIGQPKLFNITKCEKNPEGDEVYVLRSKDGYRSTLKVKHYKNYGFGVGDELNCEIYGYTGLGELRVEPENPFYKIGEIYEFDLASQKKTPSTTEIENDIVTLIDISGNLCGIKLTEQLETVIKYKTRLKCRVVGFRKGRPRLEYID